MKTTPRVKSPSIVHDRGHGYSNSFTLCRGCTTLPTRHDFSSLSGIYLCHRSLPLVSDLEHVPRPLQCAILSQSTLSKVSPTPLELKPPGSGPLLSQVGQHSHERQPTETVGSTVLAHCKGLGTCSRSLTKGSERWHRYMPDKLEKSCLVGTVVHPAGIKLFE